ncbi:MOS1T transposase, partial [Pseudoatta argentina]
MKLSNLVFLKRCRDNNIPKFLQFKDHLSLNNLLKNLSNKDLSQDTISNFAMASRKIPKEEIISQIESTIYRLLLGQADNIRRQVINILSKAKPVTNTSDYTKKMKNFLSDKAYKKLDKDPTNTIAQNIKILVKKNNIPSKTKIKASHEVPSDLIPLIEHRIEFLDTTCRDWFRRFKNNDFQLEDKERSGAPKKFEDKELEQLLDEDPSQTLSELGKILQVDESTVSKRLKGLGMIQKQGHWVPRAFKEKRPLYAQRHDKVILLHDNARPNVAQPVKTYLETLKWEVLPHPLYSPDIAPSDFHLFRLMAHGLADRRFHSYEEAQKLIDSWIGSKDMSFFRRGIYVLLERWEKVDSSDGQYLK